MKKNRNHNLTILQLAFIMFTLMIKSKPIFSIVDCFVWFYSFYFLSFLLCSFLLRFHYSGDEIFQNYYLSKIKEDN